MSLGSYLCSAPKAELHVHLEGSIRPATLLELARRNNVPLPAATEEGLRRLFAFRNFDHFIEMYVICAKCLRTTEDYELVTYEFGAEMARQHVRYAEVTFSPSENWGCGVPQEVWWPGLIRGRERARADFDAEINWVFGIIRSWTDASRTVPTADYTTSVAIEGMADGVVALGLGGSEVGSPPEPFAPWFARARAAGLHSDPHAGEHGGPESVWGALRALGAERIGHGVRAIEDPTLVEHLATHRIPLEVNPTSNVCLGVYPDLAAHPLRRLHDAGVIITVNADDPALFNTTLNDEVALLANPFDLPVSAIDAILLNGVQHCFLPPEQRRAMKAAFVAELDVLKGVHLTA